MGCSSRLNVTEKLIELMQDENVLPCAPSRLKHTNVCHKPSPPAAERRDIIDHAPRKTSGTSTRKRKVIYDGETQVPSCSLRVTLCDSAETQTFSSTRKVNASTTPQHSWDTKVRRSQATVIHNVSTVGVEA